MAAKYTFCLEIIPAIICLCLYSAKAMEDDNSSVLGYSAKDLASEQSMRALYEKWMMKHQRFYNGIDEASIRYDIFKDNLKFIEAENGEEGKAYVLGLNKFADLSSEEFMQKYLGSKGGAKDRASNFKYGNLGPNDLPSSVDWREKGAVGAIKDQGKCGSCWAFSTIASVEGINQITTGKLVSLSEQQLVDCSKDKNQGCNGGWLDHAFKYIIKNGGIDSEKKYPYQASDGQCKKNKIKNYIVSIDDYEDVPTKNETALQAAVANQPVSVCIEASGRSFQFYAKGIFTGKCGTKIDHAVNVVGYGTENGLDYWTVRNSWGPKWGENGYIRMQRNLKHKSGICGIGLEASYPIKKLTNPGLEEL